MTRLLDASGNAVSRQDPPEKFQSFAFAELQACPPWQPGVCFRPDCSASFTPRRDWQIYCCTNCERRAVSEFRAWGHRMALPLLVWRIGKYAPTGTPEADLTRAARSYIARMQSAWLADRRARQGEG